MEFRKKSLSVACDAFVEKLVNLMFIGIFATQFFIHRQEIFPYIVFYSPKNPFFNKNVKFYDSATFTTVKPPGMGRVRSKIFPSPRKWPSRSGVWL